MRFPTLHNMNPSFTLPKVNFSPIVVKVTVVRTLTEQYGSGHEQNIIWRNMDNSLQSRSGLISCSSFPGCHNHLTSFWQNVKTLFIFHYVRLTKMKLALILFALFYAYFSLCVSVELNFHFSLRYAFLWAAHILCFPLHLNGHNLLLVTSRGTIFREEIINKLKVLFCGGISQELKRKKKT